MKISIVIPCYNSEKTIEVVVKDIKNKMVQMGEQDYEIILVNDCSADNTFKVISELCEKDKHIIGIGHSKNCGQHAALMAGYRHASGDVIVSMDDDGQTPAYEMDKLLKKIEEGYDVVFADYAAKKHSAFRNFGSYVAKRMEEIMISKPKELYLSSYFVMKKYVKDEIIKYSNPYPYVSGLVLRTTKSICNVVVDHKERICGESGYSFKSLLALWMNGFTAFSILPLRLASFGGIGVAFIGFIFAIVTIVTKFTDPTRTVGWSSIISILLILGGSILVVLGLIGEYVGRIYISINNTPQYVIKNIINYGEDEEC